MAAREPSRGESNEYREPPAPEFGLVRAIPPGGRRRPVSADANGDMILGYGG